VNPVLSALREVPLLVWRFPAPVLGISSAVLGGGIGPCSWVINATVPMSYDRDDPAVHLGEMAAELGLDGPGVGLLTGVDVAGMVSALDDDVRVWATVGLGAPIQASAAPAAFLRPGTLPAGTLPSGALRPGTVNIVAWVPQRLSLGALVNAVATITEAKTQAVRDLGLAATGTATDAVCVLCPPSGDPAAYGGPRSRWGAPLARAVHQAVLDGGAANLAGPQSWSDRFRT
jgi:adenosylcobinamide hydrolase